MEPPLRPCLCFSEHTSEPHAATVTRDWLCCSEGLSGSWQFWKAPRVHPMGGQAERHFVRTLSRISAVLLQAQRLTNFEVPEGKASCYGLQRGLRLVRVNKVSSGKDIQWKVAHLYSPSGAMKICCLVLEGWSKIQFLDNWKQDSLSSRSETVKSPHLP